MKPIITIAIPSYNKESYIKRCIDSVLQQDITKRIIVIDNQSTDNTWEIINTYGEEVIKVQNDSNLWMAWNWNRCIELCDTELLMILHADDELQNNALVSYIDFYKKHDSLWLIHANTTFIYEHSNIKMQSMSDHKEIRTKWKDSLNKVIWDANIICSSVVVPKRIYDKEWYFIKDSLSSDIEMWSRIAKDYDIWYINKSLINIYVNDDSTGKWSLINRSIQEILKDRDHLNKIMLSYYNSSDYSQGIQYANKAIISWLLIIFYTAIQINQYKKALQTLYYIIFKYNGLCNKIVWQKWIKMIGRILNKKTKNLFTY